MKIGIYTFFRGSYGAVLQAFSLEKTIKKMYPDDDVLLVDFKTELHCSLEKIFRRWSSNFLYNVVWQIHILFRYRQLKKKRDAFDEFKEKFDYTSRYSSQADLLSNPPSVDVHLTGSDQVFNPHRNYRDVYYLNFRKGEARKVAYAPSFGVNQFSDDDKEYIKRLLADFDALSCRESDGAQLMSSLLDRDVPQVLDPVFLLSDDEWRTVEIQPEIKQKYVFVYCLKDTKRLLKYAKKNYPGMTVVLLSPNDLRFYSGCRHFYYPGPREFIGLIDHAEVVVTDSFHGTVFSILFNKEFRTVITRPEVSVRIVSLLSTLGLSSNLVSENDPQPFTEDGKNTLARMRTISMEYLKQSLCS